MGTKIRCLHTRIHPLVGDTHEPESTYTLFDQAQIYDHGYMRAHPHQ